MNDLNEIHKLRLNGEKRIQQQTNEYLKEVQKEIDDKWKQFEDTLLKLGPVIPYLEYSKPYTCDFNNIEVIAKIPNHLFIYMKYHYMESSWIQIPQFIIKCGDCGSMITKQLDEALYIAWKHYPHEGN